MLNYDDERMLYRHERQWLEEPDDYEECDDWMDYLDAHEAEERELWESGR